MIEEMEKKAFKNNAQPKSGYLRAFLGFGALCSVVFLLGWAFSSLTMGLIAVVFVGLVVPLSLVLWNRGKYFHYKNSQDALNWKTQPDLTDFYLHLKLWKPGPNPEIWIRNDSDLGLVYLGIPLGHWQKEILLVTSEWLALPIEKKKSDLEALWNCIGVLSDSNKRLLGLQMALWNSVFFPVGQLVSGFQLAIESLGFRELPPLALWIQLPLRKLKQIWFGPSIDLNHDWLKFSVKGKGFHYEARLQTRKSRISAKKNLIELGPWILENPQDRHPVWELMTDSL
jgi:hypothetical protein